MPTFMNVVRVQVKMGKKNDYLKKLDESPKMEGLILEKHIQTGPSKFCFVGEWENEDALAKARPKMIEFLNSIRSLLEEISPELGVTDPVSGPVVKEKK